MTRKILFFSLCMLLSLGASAQRKKKITEPTPEELAQQALEEAYNTRLQSTEQVTFIDSLVVPLKSLFSSLQISSENGSVHPYSTYFNMPDSTQASVYVSQLGNRRIFANTKGTSLLESDRLDTQWAPAHQLQGLPAYTSIGYPYMLNDGATLYFAAQGDESLGGWDIFMSRYDADSRTYLTPENIGTPFNSKANDYLYVIDEYYQLGFFVTDRNQPKDTVCIYCFIPNESRRIYDYNALGHERILSLANISCIRDSWSDRATVNKAVERLHELKQSLTRTDSDKNTFSLVINDRYTYTTLNQFRNSEARQLATQWLSGTAQIEGINNQLANLRDQYHARKTEAMASRIQELESQRDSLTQQTTAQLKQIRQLESH